MEVSRIGSRFYENAAQSGKKVKGKQISSICGLLFLMFDIANAAKCIV